MCATDEMPSAWCFARIDPGLAGGNGHRSSGHAHSRRCAARQGELLIHPRHVRKPRNEPDNVDAVRPLSVKGNDVRFADSRTLGNLSEIWPEFTAVANVDGYFSTIRLADLPRARGEMTEPRFEIVTICPKRIEVHRN